MPVTQETVSYLAAVDAGASEIKASIFDSAGNEIARACRDCPVESPHPGWAECPPDILMHWPLELLGQALRSRAIQGDQIKAVAITGSTGTVLPIGVDGLATAPVILWYDSRARSAASELTGRLSPDRFAQLTGVPLDHVSVVSKILWFRAEHPDAYAATAVFAHPQTAALHAVTGSGWFCDDSHGPYFGLMDLDARRWSDELLAATQIRPELLPQLVAPGTVVGTPSAVVARKLGLNPQTPVVAAGADASCFTLGAGVEGVGTASAYIGTAGVIGVVTDRPVRHSRLTCTPSALPGHWDVQSLLLTGGSAYKWLRTLLSDSTSDREAISFEDLNTLASGVPPGSDGLIVVPHHAGAGTPLWNPEASGLIVGLRLSHGRAHLARATLEGVAYALRHALEALQEVVSPIRRLRFSGGGSTSELWSQIMADVTGLPVSVPVCSESTALGAAIVAGVATGVFSDFNAALSAMSKMDKQWEPSQARSTCYETGYQSYLRVLSQMGMAKSGG
jgi:xylulokinase